MNYLEAHQEYVQIMKDCNFRNIPAPPADPYSLDSLRDVPDEVKEICIQLDQQQIDFIQQQIRDLLGGAFDKPFKSNAFEFSESGHFCSINSGTDSSFEEYFKMELVSKTGRSVSVYLAKDGEVYVKTANYGLARVNNSDIKEALHTAKKRHGDRIQAQRDQHKKLTANLEPKQKQIADLIPLGKLTQETIDQIKSGDFVYMGDNASHSFSVALRNNKFAYKTTCTDAGHCDEPHLEHWKKVLAADEVAAQADVETEDEDEIASMDESERLGYFDAFVAEYVLKQFNPDEFELYHDQGEAGKHYRKVERNTASDGIGYIEKQVRLLIRKHNSVNRYNLTINTETVHLVDDLSDSYFGSKFIG